MIPSKFDYVVARSLDQALQLLGKHGTDAKILSGGHSLIPLMKFRLATPSVVVDVGRLSDLRFIREEEEDIVVGGLATHHMLESSALLLEKAPVLSMAAAQVGDVQVRNRGTIGGSLVHADPAADLPAAVLALNARIKVVGAGGEREIPADRFFVGMLESAVRPDEILTEVRVRKSDAGNGAAYLKVPQPASGFSSASISEIWPPRVGRSGSPSRESRRITHGVPGRISSRGRCGRRARSPRGCGARAGTRRSDRGSILRSGPRAGGGAEVGRGSAFGRRVRNRRRRGRSCIGRV